MCVGAPARRGIAWGRDVSGHARSPAHPVGAPIRQRLSPHARDTPDASPWRRTCAGSGSGDAGDESAMNQPGIRSRECSSAGKRALLSVRASSLPRYLHCCRCASAQAERAAGLHRASSSEGESSDRARCRASGPPHRLLPVVKPAGPHMGRPAAAMPSAQAATRSASRLTCSMSRNCAAGCSSGSRADPPNSFSRSVPGA